MFLTKLKNVGMLFLMRLLGLLRVFSLILLVVIGVPIAYDIIPANVKPDNVWDFANSVLLLYLVTMLTLAIHGPRDGEGDS